MLGDTPGVAEAADDDGDADDAVSAPPDPQPVTTSTVPRTAAVSGQFLRAERGFLADNNFRDRLFIGSPCPHGGYGVN